MASTRNRKAQMQMNQGERMLSLLIAALDAPVRVEL
jgi:hypothetical protein